MNHRSTIATAVVSASLGFGVAAVHDTAQADPSPRGVCFADAEWSAADVDRPCARVARIWEDGSVRVRVTAADGSPMYRADVGNPDR